MRNVLFIFFLVSCYGAFAQSDYYFKIGEEELSGIDIYGLNEDSLKTIWITTNNGLYSYDGYQFERYSSEAQVNKSLFHPRFDQNGVLYCNNLSGQIFKVVNEQLVVAHQVPDSLLGSLVSFNFLSNNQMIVISNGIYSVSQQGEIEVIGKRIPRSIMTKLHDGSFILRYDKESVLTISESGYTFHPWNNEFISISAFYQRTNGELYEIIDRSVVYSIDTIGSEVKLTRFLETDYKQGLIYPTSKLWLAKATSGVREVDFEQRQLSAVYYSDYFISNAFEDAEGNTLLATFKKGIIVIPKSRRQMIKTADNEQVSKVCEGPGNSIFYGTNTGMVYRGDGESFEQISDEAQMQIEHLEYFPEDEVLFINPSLLLDLKSNSYLNTDSVSNTKCYARIDRYHYLIGTRGALYEIRFKKGKKEIVRIFKTGRTSFLVYCESTKEILVNTSRGLLLIDEAGNRSKIQFNGSDFVVTDLKKYRNKFLVATQDFGVLLLDNGVLQPFINEEDNGLINDDVRQIEVKNDTIYASLEGQLQVFDLNQKPFAVLGKSEGIQFKIQDFVVDNSYIWISSNGSLSRIHKSVLSTLNDPVNDAMLKIQSVEVFLNGQPIDAHQPIKLKDQEISFTIHAPSLSKSGDLTYQYKLNDEKWNVGEFMENTVRYQSLAFGEYTLVIKLMFKGREIDQKMISFTVSTPFYYQTWFLLSIALALILVGQLIYRNRLKIKSAQNELQSELNLLKLTTLQSQMNPHFMFNALNSIQEYIITNERKLAVKYLGKFAGLMRLYLNHSQVKEVTIEEELHALNLYLDLEKLRFNDTLEYEVSIAEEVNQDFTIPSFLAQPYVENAIKHGLFHKKTNRKLWVSFRVEPDDYLVYAIKDNGIGRAKSMEMNKAQINHKSFATKATKSRVELLNMDRTYPILEEIIDLKEEDGSPGGTLVVLKIPLLLA